jgi:transcriptional regulator with XRE-family HTH domain
VQAEIVGVFAERLREHRRSRGLTQAELARESGLAPLYVWRLEGAGAAPGIDVVERLAKVLGIGVADLLPISPPSDPLAVLKDRGKRLFDELLQSADRDTLLMLTPLLKRLTEAPSKSR